MEKNTERNSVDGRKLIRPLGGLVGSLVEGRAEAISELPESASRMPTLARVHSRWPRSQSRATLARPSAHRRAQPVRRAGWPAPLDAPSSAPRSTARPRRARSPARAARSPAPGSITHARPQRS